MTNTLERSQPRGVAPHHTHSSSSSLLPLTKSSSIPSPITREQKSEQANFLDILKDELRRNPFPQPPFQKAPEPSPALITRLNSTKKNFIIAGSREDAVGRRLQACKTIDKGDAIALYPCMILQSVSDWPGSQTDAYIVGDEQNTERLYLGIDETKIPSLAGALANDGCVTPAMYKQLLQIVPPEPGDDKSTIDAHLDKMSDMIETFKTDYELNRAAGRHNAIITGASDNDAIYLKATKEIKAGQDISVTYGSDYWIKQRIIPLPKMGWAMFAARLRKKISVDTIDEDKTLDLANLNSNRIYNLAGDPVKDLTEITDRAVTSILPMIGLQGEIEIETNMIAVVISIMERRLKVPIRRKTPLFNKPFLENLSHFCTLIFQAQKLQPEKFNCFLLHMVELKIIRIIKEGETEPITPDKLENICQNPRDRTRLNVLQPTKEEIPEPAYLKIALISTAIVFLSLFLAI